MADPVWAEWGLSEALPGPEVRTPAAVAAFARRAAGPFCHPAGTARMGRDPGDSAVDADLRVHGIDGLRVADASVMPLLPSTPPNAACLMLGVRAAALVAESAA
jgi:choline dehydrogenase